MSNSTAYEIRRDILKMARDTVWDEYHVKRGDIELLCGENNNAKLSLLSQLKLPTPEDILECAAKLYSFVNQK